MKMVSIARLLLSLYVRMLLACFFFFSSKLNQCNKMKTEWVSLHISTGRPPHTHVWICTFKPLGCENVKGTVGAKTVNIDTHNSKSQLKITALTSSPVQYPSSADNFTVLLLWSPISMISPWVLRISRVCLSTSL